MQSRTHRGDDSVRRVVQAERSASGLKRTGYAAAGAVAIGLLALVLYLWRKDAAPSPAPLEPSAPVAATPAVPPPTAPETAIHYPIDAELAAPSAKPFDWQTALSELFGASTVQSMFRLDEFPRRLAATVDNLGRSQATAILWPVNPASGRFKVEGHDGAEFISADNGLRYTPYVLLLERLDARQAMAVYTRIYPALQHAYEELGYPKGYFNDRLVQVIDQLLATPESDAPLRVQLAPINGPVRPARPWVLYQFADPSLESLSAGQKILLRMGPANERRIKAKLAEVRRLVATPGPTR
jgi:Protein of unknown function (DUF3014)